MTCPYPELNLAAAHPSLQSLQALAVLRDQFEGEDLPEQRLIGHPSDQG